MFNLKDQVVLVTGAHGFLGHHVVQRFAHHCDLVIPRRDKLDLLDKEDIATYLGRMQPDIIIHLAAKCGGIGANRERPGEFLYDNLTMTTNLIDCARRLDLVKFVGVGSVCSYPKFASVPFKEEDLYNGYPEETNAGYGIAKRIQLEMLKSYKAQYGMNSIFLMPVNMVGEWDNFDDSSSHVIPAMMKRFHNAKLAGQSKVVVWGDGSASREFLYAGDCAEAIFQATQNLEELTPINLGTGKECTIKELVAYMQEVVGYEGTVEWDVSKPNGQPRRCLDVSKAKEKFGFEARVDLKEALRRTYVWAQENGIL